MRSGAELVAPAAWRQALDTAVRLAPGRCPDGDLAQLVAVRDHVEQRLGLGDALTVAALAGGTGVGKSALVNRLAGTEVVVEGVRRPTTATPVAIARTIDDPTARLLDWLGIEDRRQLPDALPDGLVIVDLPDHDSIEVAHRRTSERLAARVDVVVVVVDAIKYARADLHAGPLAALSSHAEVLLVVLNRIDELDGANVDRVRADLAARLAEDGLPGVAIHTTSAATGAGIAGLRAELTRLAAARGAAARRLAADVAVVADDVLTRVPALPALTREVDPLVEAALDAADAYRSLGLGLLEQRRAARRAVRSPLARAVHAPARAARWAGRGFGFGRSTPGPDADPAPARSQTRLADRLAESLDLAATTGRAHTVLQGAIELAAGRAAPEVVATVRRTAAEVAATRRRWWPVAAAARGLAEATALAGLLWQVALGVISWLGLPEVAVPRLTGSLTWPAGLLLAGLAARVLLGALSRAVLAASSRRLRRRARRRMQSAVATVVTDELLGPYDQEAAAVAELRAALTALR